MEPPYSLDPNVVRDAKMEVLRCLKPIVGKDVERLVLSTAVKAHAEDRVFLIDTATVVF